MGRLFAILGSPRALAVLGLSCLGLGLALAWVHTVRLQSEYELRTLQARRVELTEHVAKLRTEWTNRTSPHALVRQGREMGLRPAVKGQIRTLKVGTFVVDAGGEQ